MIYIIYGDSSRARGDQSKRVSVVCRRRILLDTLFRDDGDEIGDRFSLMGHHLSVTGREKIVRGCLIGL